MGASPDHGGAGRSDAVVAGGARWVGERTGAPPRERIVRTVTLREAAEYPNCFVPLGPGEERIETDRYTLCLGVGATVQRQRFPASELGEVVAEVREHLRARGRSETEWEIGAGAEPAGLAELLLEHGLERTGFATALVVDSPPPAPPSGFNARTVGSKEEFWAGTVVQMTAFGASEADIELRRADAARWDAGHRVMHAVWREGRIVCAGTCAPTSHGLALFGGATLHQERGRGAYRALIGARWEHATSLGAAALLTQSGPMSAPILTRLGFRPVGSVTQLIDRL